MKKITEIEVAVAEVVDYLRLTGKFAPALTEVVRRKMTASAAKEMEITVSDDELQEGADTFRAACGLNKAEDTKMWLNYNGITIEALEKFIETNILISKFKDALEKKANRDIYLSSARIQDIVREAIYENWIDEALKSE